MRKITFVINYFYPDLASTGQLLTELCLELQNDFEITVIAAQPGYAGEATKSKRLYEEDHLENIKVIRIKLPKVDKTSKLSRVYYIFSYFILAMYAMFKERKTDLIYTISQPPVLGGLIGTIGKFFKRARHVYNVQDFNPEQAAAVAFTNKQLVYKVAKYIDKLNCRFADHVIVVGQDMGDTLKQRFAGKRVPSYSVINNWTNEEDIVPLPKKSPEVLQFLKEYNLEEKFIVMYSGNIGLFYDLENLIKLVEPLRRYSDLIFLFIGEGAVKQKMMDYVHEQDLNNVMFLPYQPKEFIKYSLNAADVHLVVNQRGIKGVSVPSKIYGVLAAGRPILGVLEEGSEAERLIRESGAGVVVEPQDYPKIITAIETLYKMNRNTLDDMGMRGRCYLDQNLKRETSIQKYRELLKHI